MVTLHLSTPSATSPAATTPLATSAVTRAQTATATTGTSTRRLSTRGAIGPSITVMSTRTSKEKREREFELGLTDIG